MSIFRRTGRGAPALIPDFIEAARLGDGVRDSILFVGALTLRKLAALGLPTDPGNHVITIRTRGVTLAMDVWAAEHRPLREIVARDEYGLFGAARLRPGDHIVDVGANIGVFAVHAATFVRPSGRVLAFEPHPGAFDRLRRNVRANDLEETVVTINKAVSDREGQLWFDPASLSVENRVGRSGSVAVAAVTLDNAPEVRRLDPIRILKIDVEGHEVAVLAGARATLARTRTITVEYHSEAARVSVLTAIGESGFDNATEVVYRPGLGLISACRSP